MKKQYIPFTVAMIASLLFFNPAFAAGSPGGSGPGGQPTPVGNANVNTNIPTANANAGANAFSNANARSKSTAGAVAGAIVNGSGNSKNANFAKTGSIKNTTNYEAPAYAPSISISPSARCMGSFSGGYGNGAISIGAGGSYTDKECNERESIRVGLEIYRVTGDKASLNIALALYKSLQANKEVVAKMAKASSTTNVASSGKVIATSTKKANPGVCASDPNMTADDPWCGEF